MKYRSSRELWDCRSRVHSRPITRQHSCCESVIDSSPETLASTGRVAMPALPGAAVIASATRFNVASNPVQELMEARAENRLLLLEAPVRPGRRAHRRRARLCLLLLQSGVELPLALHPQLGTRFVEDEALRDRLKEAKGIGTPATRAEIISGLKKQGFLAAQGKNVVPTERGLALFGVLGRADPGLVDPGVTAEMECLLDDVLTGRQEMMGAIDAVCASARRIIGKLAVQGSDGEALVPGNAPGGGDRPPTAAMRKYAASIARRKGTKPPRGYTKSAAVCRAFLDEHAPRRSQGQSERSPADGPAHGTTAGGTPEGAGSAGSGKRARPEKSGQRRKSARGDAAPPPWRRTAPAASDARPRSPRAGPCVNRHSILTPNRGSMFHA